MACGGGGLGVCSGAEAGPRVLITGNIHGDEVTGTIVIHRFIESLAGKLDQLKGTIVAIPSLNPTGHLQGTRYPQFQSTDPNRKWPDSKPERLVDQFKAKEDATDIWDKLQREADEQPGPQAEVFKKIYAVFESIKPDYHIDLHTFSTLSIPFIFLDRVLYDGEAQKEEAHKLFAKTKEMVTALGLSVLVERPARLYVKQGLHRSTSGATLNKLRIPSCTIELGPMRSVEPRCRAAGLAALHNLLVWAGMVQDKPEAIDQSFVLNFDEPHRYLVYPSVTKTGIVDYSKDAGDRFEKGDELAVVRTMDGQVVERIHAEMSGWLAGWFEGVAKYPGAALGMVAVPDGKDMPMVVDWASLPEDTLRA